MSHFVLSLSLCVLPASSRSKKRRRGKESRLYKLRNKKRGFSVSTKFPLFIFTVAPLWLGEVWGRREREVCPQMTVIVEDNVPT